MKTRSFSDTLYDQISAALLESWSLQTSSKWTTDNPACGQCGVTALVVQDRLGGEILKTMTAGGWHYYNRVNNNVYDFTASQFAGEIEYLHVLSSRTDAFGYTNQEQYDALSSRMAELLDRQ
ncbi:YunG family protein [Paenibacillus jiagnxiensis]|uniref:YunG family protein n=1 Tax=Paenibacillus jiagnxiensis TaxID=3228926 RepID=UPI0033BA8103